jgi:uncharacterized membrane protein YcaP (DUF421 family)
VARIVTDLGVGWGQLVAIVIAAVVIYATVILAARLVGLRSFAKMSAFDLAMTVAVGSVIASASTGAAPLAAAVTAIVVLFGLQASVARLRRTSRLDRLVDNQPLLLMDGATILDDHLDAVRLTREDLVAKLRSANVSRLDQVQAVVFETTGDISVLHGDRPLDPALLDGVRRDVS